MAEYVHQTLEEMLPELEEMTRSELFTSKETKIILKKREAFEYRLRQRTKTKKAYLNYIEYEERLLELIKIRKRQNGVDHSKREVENSIIERIHNLHRLLTTRFSEDISLWEKHIKFCIDMHQPSYVTRLYNKILRIHSHREDIWVKAAQFERSPKGNGNPEVARELLLKGQRVLPNSETIYLEMYQMELDMASTILKRKMVLSIAKQQDSNDEPALEETQKPEFKLVQIVHKKALDIFPNNPKFHLKMLNVCSKFKLASHEMKAMTAELKQIYSGIPAVWNGLAMCELNKYKKLSEGEKKNAANRCMKIFKEGLEKASSESMWNYCLRGHLNVLALRRGFDDAADILESTLCLFQEAISDGMLSQELFGHLIQMLTAMGLHEDAALVAEKGIESYPSSSNLWNAHLANMTERGVALEDVLKAFQLATRRVTPETSWPLWQFILHFVAGKDNSALESLMEDACRSVTSAVCKPAKEWCLEWTFRHGGIKNSRQVYKSLKCMRPITLEFYRRYILIENSQLEPNLELIRSAFEEALVEFGQSNQDLWLNYMEMERKIGQDASKAGLIQQRAINSLSPEHKENFIRTNVMIALRVQ